ncbi:MAG: pyridoxal phosphate-dependent aminotransferase family protein [Cytophagales bacterium]|nr:pyridoxal phosphate-dependent aminotransferase family protein [Cytophagales bacterium]
MFLDEHPELEQALQERIAYFRAQAGGGPGPAHAIQPVVVPGNARVKALAAALQKGGLDLRPILSPTVRPGQERLRVCLHAFNTREEIDLLIRLLGEHQAWPPA